MKKRISSIIFLCALCFMLSVPAAGAQTGPYDTPILDTWTRLADMADVLSDSEENDLIARLDEVSERQQMDVVIVTINDAGDKTLMEYADDFYDYNGYGVGEEYDGLLLLVRTETDGSYSSGNSWISTCGYGITAFTDKGIQYIGKQITPDLTSEDYFTAFDQFISLADDFITQAYSGQPYDGGNLPRGAFPLARNLLIALFGGLIAACIAILIMKGQLKTVRMKPSASDYLKKDSLKITREGEIFLYSHIDCTEKANDSDSGSSTHTSSSGTTHGGGGF